MPVLLAWAGAVAAVAATMLLRFAWGRAARSVLCNGAAWALLVFGVVLGGMAYGAWGMAVVSLAAMGAAFVLLVDAGIRTAANGARASERRANILPERAPLKLGRRLVTFLFNVPLAFAAALILSIAVRGIFGFAGWNEANGNVLAMFLFPLIWTALVTALLMTEKRRSQAVILAVPALLGGLVLVAGGSA